MKTSNNMKQFKNFFFFLLVVVLFTSCETVNNNGQPIISYGEAFAAQWRLDAAYVVMSIISFLLFAGYSFYITKYKEWQVGNIIIAMVLLMIFTGITFGMPITTHLNTTKEAVSRGHYIL